MNELVSPDTFSKILDKLIKNKYNEILTKRNSFQSLKQIHQKNYKQW